MSTTDFSFLSFIMMKMIFVGWKDMYYSYAGFLFFAVGVVASNMLAGAVSIGFRIYGVGLFLQCYFLAFFFMLKRR